MLIGRFSDGLINVRPFENRQCERASGAAQRTLR